MKTLLPPDEHVQTAPTTLTLSELGRPITESGWALEARVRGIAGTMVLVSVALAVVYDTRWLYLTGFVGVNLLQSAFSGWCLMSNLLGLLFPRLRPAR